MTREDEFDAACREAINDCRRMIPPYRATTWLRMIEQHGAVEAAKRLVISADIQSGFKELVERDRSDLTIEFALLNPRWANLFDSELLDAARWRLRQAGVEDLPA